jgi:2-hydroxychromene-2-carboxylate isomerase
MEHPMTVSPSETTVRKIEFWFDFGSNYSYLTAMRIEGLAARAGIGVAWRAFLLGPIFQSFGWESSPFVLQKQKGAYVWRDMERQAAKYDVAWSKPTTFPRRAILPSRIAVLAADEPWIGTYVRATMTRNFADDKDIESEDAVREVLTGIGVSADEVISKAKSEQVKARLRQATEVATARGIFGAPMLFVGEEMFWGNDRLEDAVAYATSLDP